MARQATKATPEATERAITKPVATVELFPDEIAFLGKVFSGWADSMWSEGGASWNDERDARTMLDRLKQACHGSDFSEADKALADASFKVYGIGGDSGLPRGDA